MFAMVFHTFASFPTGHAVVYSLLVIAYNYAYLLVHLYFSTYREDLALTFPMALFASLVVLSVVSALTYNPLLIVLLALVLAVHSSFSLFLYKFVVFRDGMMVCCVDAVQVDEETIRSRDVVPEVYI